MFNFAVGFVASLWKSCQINYRY